MSVYSPEENKDTQTLASDEDLRSITGIPKKVETEMEANAADGETQDIAARESAASGSQKATPPSREESMLGNFYKPTTSIGQKRRFRMNKKQSGGLAGAIIGVALLWVGITTSGPLQFIHFGQLIQAFHFSDQENDSSSRASKLIKWMYYKDVSRTRLGILSGAYSDRIEAKLNKNGFTTQYDKTTGRFLGYEFDPKTAKEGYFSDISSRDPTNKVEARLKEGLSTKNVTLQGGKYLMSESGLSLKDTRTNRKLLKNTYDVSNTKGKIISAYEKRILIKRANLSYNPITRLDSKINKTVAEQLKKINDARKTRLTGETVPSEVTPEKKPGATDATTSDAVTEGERAAKDVKSGKVTAGKIAGGSAAVVGLLCIVQSVAKNVDVAKKANAVVPAMQASAEVLGVASKAQDGGDIGLTALGEYSKSLYSKENGSWAGANSIMFEQGKTQKGKTLPSELNPNPDSGPVIAFLSAPGVSQVLSVCPLLGNPLVAVIGAVTAPVMAAASTVLIGQFLPIIESILTGGGPVDLSQPQYAGGVYGEAANVGGRLMANETCSAMGCRPLTNTEEVALNTETKASAPESRDPNRSIADKFFNPYKYDTPVAQAIDVISPGNVSATIAQLPRRIINMGFAPFNLFSVKARADTVANPKDIYYGIPKVAFAPGVLDSVENPYANATSAADILMGPEADKYKYLLEQCNHIIVDTSNKVLDFGTENKPITDYNSLPEECKNDSDQKLKTIRVAAFDTNTMKSMACVDFNDAKSCADMGLGDAPTNDTTTTLPTVTGWVWPIKKETLDNPSGAGLTQCWLHYYGGASGYHAAIDIGVRYKPVYAANSGTVLKEENDGYATLIIQHAGGLFSVYEHMSQISVNVGDKVTAGQPIGISGEVGAPGAPHLHFGITTSAAGDNWGTYANPWYTVNPLDFLPNDYSPALLKDDAGSCLTKDLKTRSDFGWSLYQTQGQYAPYKQ